MAPLFIQKQSDYDKKPSLQKQYATSSDSATYDRIPQPTNLRKYVLLLHDSIAIRFTAYPRHQFRYGAPETINPTSLFSSLVSTNKPCYWNPQLSTAISSLEFKGFLAPSTLLVRTSNKHTNTIRNAWARRILRDPPGFRIDFLGEVEELVTQPVQQGQFAPLSDSLCWAIAEITGDGDEAFITQIQSKLQRTFPSISQPPRDLITQTLEKLIRTQKIYQTPTGYHVVTPSISTYMSYSRTVTPTPQIYNKLVYSDCFDKRVYSPWGSTPSVPQFNDLSTMFIPTQNNVMLRRHNSLKIIRNKHENSYHFHNHPSMGARSLSFRLSKCNSLFDSDKESDNEHEPTQSQPRDDPNPQVAINKKRPSFLTRLFSFRCTSRNKEQTIQQTPRPRSAPPRRRHKPRSSSPSSSASGIYASIPDRYRSSTHASMHDIVHKAESSDTSR